MRMNLHCGDRHRLDSCTTGDIMIRVVNSCLAIGLILGSFAASASAASIHGELFDLERKSLDLTPVTIEVSTYTETGTLLQTPGTPISVKDKLKPGSGPVTEITTSSGKFDIEIDDLTDGTTSRLVMIRFGRPGRRETERLMRLVIQNGKDYHVDVVVPLPPEEQAVCYYPAYYYYPAQYYSHTRRKSWFHR